MRQVTRNIKILGMHYLIGYGDVTEHSTFVSSSASWASSQNGQIYNVLLHCTLQHVRVIYNTLTCLQNGQVLNELHWILHEPTRQSPSSF